MAQESDQIKEHIDQKRAEVTRDLHELEHHVKDQVRQVADWRTHYRNYTGAFLGAAFGGVARPPQPGIASAVLPLLSRGRVERADVLVRSAPQTQ